MKTASLETSKELQEAGIKVTSHFSWCEKEKKLHDKIQQCTGDFDCWKRHIPAPTADELWPLLPEDGFKVHGRMHWVIMDSRAICIENDEGGVHDSVMVRDNPAEAIAKILLKLDWSRVG